MNSQSVCPVLQERARGWPEAVDEDARPQGKVTSSTSILAPHHNVHAYCYDSDMPNTVILYNTHFQCCYYSCNDFILSDLVCMHT